MNSREKGKRGERELAKKLSEVFGKACRRGQQFSGLGGDDVVGLGGIHVECKWVQALNVETAMRQSERDAGDGEVPIVCHRRNGTEWLLTVRLERVPKLVELLTKGVVLE